MRKQWRQSANMQTSEKSERETMNFENLYETVAGNGNARGRVRLENEKLFSVFLDDACEVKVYDDIERVLIEVMSGKKQVISFYLDERNAYGFLADILADEERFIYKLGAKGSRLGSVLSYVLGSILVIFPSLLIFSIWLSRSGDMETPLYVYFALTGSFGLLVLFGVFLIVAAKRGTFHRDVTFVDLVCFRMELSFDRVEYVLPNQMGIRVIDGERSMEYTIFSMRECAREWYHRHYGRSGTLFQKRSNRYIGDSLWNPGKKSFICISDGNIEVKFVIDIPADETKPAYLQAKQQWDDFVKKVQQAGWLLWDK